MIVPMRGTLAFDVYGTLIDPLGIGEALAGVVGERADRLAVAWRQKQLEYLFRRGLGRKYQPFSVCTGQALDYVLESQGVVLTAVQREALLDAWRQLPAYADAPAALRDLRVAGFCCYAFSNGEAAELEITLANAGLDELLHGIVSVEETRSFKPDPSVYAHFVENTGALLGQTWLVSGNAFDVIGALEVGWKAVWIRRDPRAVFDPWGVEPTAIVAGLAGVAELLV